MSGRNTGTKCRAACRRQRAGQPQVRARHRLLPSFGQRRSATRRADNGRRPRFPRACDETIQLGRPDDTWGRRDGMGRVPSGQDRPAVTRKAGMGLGARWHGTLASIATGHGAGSQIRTTAYNTPRCWQRTGHGATHRCSIPYAGIGSARDAGIGRRQRRGPSGPGSSSSRQDFRRSRRERPGPVHTESVSTRRRHTVGTRNQGASFRC